MIQTIKSLVLKIIYYSGTFRIVDAVHYLLAGPAVRFLFGHNVVESSHPYYDVLMRLGFLDRAEFERKILFIKRHCIVLSLEEALQAVQGGSIPRRAVVLTFDDGYKDNYHHILPILEKYRVPATFFLSSALMDEMVEFWFNRLIDCVCQSRCEQTRLTNRNIWPLRNADEKAAAIEAAARILQVLQPSDRDAVLNDIEERLCPFRTRTHLPMLSWEEVRSMAQSPLITLGAHTYSHVVLSSVSFEEACQEITRGREVLAERTGLPIRHFAYPCGRTEDYHDQIMDYLRRSGFASACDTAPGRVNALTDLMTINRVGFEHEPMHIFGLRLFGFFDALQSVKKTFVRVHREGSPAESRTTRRTMPPRTVREKTQLGGRIARSLKKLAFYAVPDSLLLQRARTDKAVFLTFDDGPHACNTEKILNILATEQIRATFFITGALASRYPGLVRKAMAHGHQVASHGWFHNRASNADFLGVRRDFLRTEHLIEEICGIHTRTFRPPYGEVTVSLLLWAFLRRMQIVLWSLDSQDDSSKSPQVILSNCKRVQGGDIMLFHDDNDALVNTLPAVIGHIRTRGFSFATILEISR